MYREEKQIILRSPHTKAEVFKILEEQVDPIPSILQSIFSWSSAYHGTSKVCGTVSKNSFELRNRTYQHFSIRAYGLLLEDDCGTQINIQWKYPIFLDHIYAVIFQRYSYDKKKILEFLREWLNAHS